MQFKPYFHHLLTILVVLLVVWVGLEARNSAVEYRFIGADASEVATISVVGEADQELVPNIATVRVGVETDDATAQLVKDDIAKRMNAIMEVAEKDLKIDEKDLQTQSFSVYPKTRWDRNTNTSVPDGFSGSQYLSVTIRDIDAASEVIDALVSAGADSVNGLQFVVEDQDEALSDIREEAIKDARKKAKALAKDLDVELVRLVGYSEPGVAEAYFEGMETFALSADDGIGGGAAPKIAPGSQEVSTRVELTFEIR